ncbi:MAG: hypothetical protein GQ540_03350 [Lutibacter sp.]|uniref:hypothetical protein n=1 Tax=Lutibacter sp. TaxID=1925666 RepID=UPI0019DB76F0|nr:hypothetical protein [Lutibacter sp.]NOR27548.1 hypothetical protein [Lutibacter sp.]
MLCESCEIGVIEDGMGCTVCGTGKQEQDEHTEKQHPNNCQCQLCLIWRGDLNEDI